MWKIHDLGLSPISSVCLDPLSRHKQPLPQPVAKDNEVRDASMAGTVDPDNPSCLDRDPYLVPHTGFLELVRIPSFVTESSLFDAKVGSINRNLTG